MPLSKMAWMAAMVAATVAAGSDAHCVPCSDRYRSTDFFFEVCLDANTGALETVGGREMAPGSGLQLKSCTVTGTTVTASDGTDTSAWPPTTARQVNVTRRFSCAGGNATAVATETFTTDAASGSVRWAMSLSSADSGLWTTEITSALGYVANASAGIKPPLAWLGGPRSNDLPSASPASFHDPIAPFAIPGGAASAAPVASAKKKTKKKTKKTAVAPVGWYVAPDYNAVYGQRTPVPGKFVEANNTADAPGCQLECARRSGSGCSIYAKSRSCWLRLDGLWGAPGTLQKEPERVSGCKLGSEPSSGAPFVPGCGTNPIAPTNFPRFMYGGGQNDIAGPHQTSSPATILPVLTYIDGGIGASPHVGGLTLAQSPEDTPIVAHSTVGQSGDTAWFNWTRQHHRFGGRGTEHEAEPISFSADFIAHDACWRPGVAWMQRRYPAFFSVDPNATATAEEVYGTGSYGDLRGAGDIGPADAEHYKKMGYKMNWDSSARFPWHGEWIPTAADGFNESWTTCFSHTGGDGHQKEGCKNTSYGEIAGWYENQRALGFHTCSYGNLFEFGWDVAKAWPNKTIDCSPAATGASNATALLCHSQRLLREKYGDALVFRPDADAPGGVSDLLLCGGLDGSCIMDPSPDLPYLAHVLDMARTSIAKTPSAGTCIDRQDWIGYVNPRADDHRTLLAVGGRLLPVRAMINSWKPAMAAFASVWHSAGQVVIINDHSNRLDMMEHVDGIFAEMGDFEPAGITHAVGSGLASMNGPVYVWNHPKGAAAMSPPVVAAGLQAHLLVGVFPMVPVKNNDHGIGGDCAPGCPYDDVYISYGAMFQALRGRRWHLAAHGVVVRAPDGGASSVAPALGNVFYVPEGTLNIAGVAKNSPVLLAAVVFAPQFGRVHAIINGVGQVLPCCADQTRCAASVVHSVIQPGDKMNANGLVLPGSYDPKTCSAKSSVSSASPPAGGSNITRGCATGGAPVVTGGSGAGITVSIDITFGTGTAISGSNTNAALIALSCPEQ